MYNRKGGRSLQEVIKLFKQIKETSSTNDKKAIIAANKDNELFKKCLVFLLDGNINTGISNKKINKKVEPSSELAPYYLCRNSRFEEVMDYLIKNNTGTDADIYEIQSFLEGHEEDREFYEQMITKKFKLGADKKVVNSVIHCLIPTWDIQQAYPLSEKNEPKDGEWFALTQKINGTNCSFYKDRLISRQGKEFTGLQHIIDDIQKLPKHENFFFNGELVRKNIDNVSDEENFQIGTGIINSDSDDKSSIKFMIYEVLPNEEFNKGESKLTYKDRRHEVLNPLSITISRNNLENIEVVPILYEGTDKTKIDELLAEMDAKKLEGLMLNKDTKWRNKRNNGILKVKSWKSADLLCTGVIEGEGKNKGTLGSIECDYKGFKLGVPGFTDEMRDYYWNNPNEIIGKIVQIKFKDETKNKQGGLSVNFPSFQCIRHDKTEPSYN